jgi:hypothetical protein
MSEIEGKATRVGASAGSERVSIKKCLFSLIKNTYNIAIRSEARTFFLPLRLSNIALRHC